MTTVYLGFLSRPGREVEWTDYTRTPVRFRQTSGIRARNAHKVSVEIPLPLHRTIVGFALYDSPTGGHALYEWQYRTKIRGGDTIIFPRGHLSVIDDA